MLEVAKNSAFKLSAIMASPDDSSPRTGLTSGQVNLFTKKENQTALQAYSANGNWQECGQGFYEVSFGTLMSDVLGRFSFVVSGAASLRFYGECQVVGALPGQIDDKLDFVSGRIAALDDKMDFVSGRVVALDDKIDTVSGQVAVRTTRSIYNAVTGLSFGGDSTAVVQSAAVYDSGVLGIQFFLERDGAVANPVSGEFQIYDQTGSQLASGQTSISDAQGVFKFARNVTLSPATLPYLDATVKDGTGRATTRTQLPVIR